MLKAIDLFCGAGGATKGLQRAGFHVTDIDINPQPRYCGDVFIQADALTHPLDLLQFDFIWASPPCQHFTLANNRDVRNLHPDLIEPVRDMLAKSGRLTVIENVPYAPIRPDVVLDGTMFPDLKVIRRRHFETNFCVPMRLGFPTANLVGRHGWVTPTDGDQSSHTRKSRARFGMPIKDSNETRAAGMGVEWMSSRREIGEAIPPAYSEFIGREAIKILSGTTA